MFHPPPLFCGCDWSPSLQPTYMCDPLHPDPTHFAPDDVMQHIPPKHCKICNAKQRHNPEDHNLNKSKSATSLAHCHLTSFPGHGWQNSLTVCLTCYEIYTKTILIFYLVISKQQLSCGPSQTTEWHFLYRNTSVRFSDTGTVCNHTATAQGQARCATRRSCRKPEYRGRRFLQNSDI